MVYGHPVFILRIGLRCGRFDMVRVTRSGYGRSDGVWGAKSGAMAPNVTRLQRETLTGIVDHVHAAKSRYINE